MKIILLALLVSLSSVALAQTKPMSAAECRAQLGSFLNFYEKKTKELQSQLQQLDPKVANQISQYLSNYATASNNWLLCLQAKGNHCDDEKNQVILKGGDLEKAVDLAGTNAQKKYSILGEIKGVAESLDAISTEAVTKPKTPKAATSQTSSGEGSN